VTPKTPASKQEAEKRARNTRAVKVGACFVLGLGALRFTVLKPDSETPPDAVAPAGAEASTEKVPPVTSVTIIPIRDPFWPVDGG
jgi:hypothetical protein